jgi:hypothetical protein
MWAKSVCQDACKLSQVGENAKELNPSTPKWESLWELKDLEMSQILGEKVQITSLVQIGIFSY